MYMCLPQLNLVLRSYLQVDSVIVFRSSIPTIILLLMEMGVAIVTTPIFDSNMRCFHMDFWNFEAWEISSGQARVWIQKKH